VDGDDLAVDDLERCGLLVKPSDSPFAIERGASLPLLSALTALWLR
jgi:hypothetical protein